MARQGQGPTKLALMPAISCTRRAEARSRVSSSPSAASALWVRSASRSSWYSRTATPAPRRRSSSSSSCRPKSGRQPEYTPQGEVLAVGGGGGSRVRARADCGSKVDPRSSQGRTRCCSTPGHAILSSAFPSIDSILGEFALLCTYCLCSVRASRDRRSRRHQSPSHHQAPITSRSGSPGPPSSTIARDLGLASENRGQHGFADTAGGRRGASPKAAGR
jgi:hypothetical protein